MRGETQIRRAARLALAAEVRQLGAANAADSLAAGSWGNIWTEAAIAALERTARVPLDDGTDD